MSDALMQFEGALVIKNVPPPPTLLCLAQENTSASFAQSHQTMHEAETALTLQKPLQSIICPVECPIFWTWLVFPSWHHVSFASIFCISYKLEIRLKVNPVKPLFLRQYFICVCVFPIASNQEAHNV